MTGHTVRSRRQPTCTSIHLFYLVCCFFTLTRITKAKYRAFSPCYSPISCSNLLSSSHTESRVCNKRVASRIPQRHDVSAPSSVPRRAPTPHRCVSSSIPYHASTISQQQSVPPNPSHRLQDERFGLKLQSSGFLRRAPDRPPR